jgi:hypothetical protein
MNPIGDHSQLEFWRESNPTFTRREWDEVMRFRMARMFEAGETIPTLTELLIAMAEVFGVDGEIGGVSDE